MTKLWFVRGIEACIGIVGGMCEVVCECVGTVCVALQGTLGGCTSSITQDLSFIH